MADLREIVTFLDENLRTAAITDYPSAMNGLQLENDGKVERIIAAVDASLAVIEEAAKMGPALLIVHHGMFWQGAQVLTGPFYRKIKTAMEAGLAIYSSHLPLDVHAEWGNNALLAKSIGLHQLKPFFETKGLLLGLQGEWHGTRQELADQLCQSLGTRAHLCAGGPDMPKNIGLITGGAGSEVAKVAACGIDTFITGEGPHWSFPLAEELGVNIFYGGHYATETFGVRHLSRIIAEKFSTEWEFIDHPTGL